jgi:hypothetical protein
MTHTQIREDITRIAQGNIQLVLNAMMDMIEGNEEALESLIVAPEVVQIPNTADRLADTIEKDNVEIDRQYTNQLIEETLEGENDYVQRNLETE